jgi:hypothetical protein
MRKRFTPGKLRGFCFSKRIQKGLKVQITVGILLKKNHSILNNYPNTVGTVPKKDHSISSTIGLSTRNSLSGRLNP